MTDPLASILSHPAIWRASRVQQAYACQQQGMRGVGTGFTALDRELPDNGWPPENLVELLVSKPGEAGEMPLLSPALSRLTQEKRWVVLISPPWLPYAPALLHHGMRPDYVIVVHSRQPRDTLWVMEQCLNSGVCAAVLAWPARLQSPQIRRLTLAAQQGRCMGVLIRDLSALHASSPAPLRIELGRYALQENRQMQLNLRIVKRRGRWPGDWLAVHWQAPLASYRWEGFQPALAMASPEFTENTVPSNLIRAPALHTSSSRRDTV